MIESLVPGRVPVTARRALLALLVGALSIGRASALLSVQDDWQRQDGSGPRYVVVDSSGNVYTRVAEGTYKYDGAGNVLAFMQDGAETAILGANLVARTSTGVDGTLVVSAADDAGSSLWQARLSRLDATVALAAVAANAAGEVYVAATSTDVATGAVTPFLAKIGVDGAVRWSVDTLAASGLAVNRATGAAYLTGPSGTAGFDAAGQAAWQDANPGTDIKVSTSGALYVVNRKGSDYALDVSVYDAAGNVTSFASGAFTTLPYGKAVHAAVIDDDGNVYLAGDVRPYSVVWDALLVKFSSRASVVWYQQLHQKASQLWNAVALDANQDVYVAGYTWDNTSYFQTAAKYDRNVGYGMATWSYVSPAGSGFGSIAVDAARKVYALGGANGRALLAKLSEYAGITATAGAGGSISPSGLVKAPVGGSQTFTIAPATGYHVANVLLDGYSSQGPVTSYTFTYLSSNRTIAASFALNSYAITASAGANGSISPVGTTMVDHGGSVTYAIAPAPGFVVADVLVDGVSVGAPTSYTFGSVSGPHDIGATFRQAVTVTSPNGGESWRRNTTQTIRWTYAGAAGTAVRVELLSGTVVSRTLATSAPIGANGAGSLSWKIPGSQATGSTFTIRVTSTTNAAAADVSDATFTIVK